jgi:hypothetical protein
VEKGGKIDGFLGQVGEGARRRNKIDIGKTIQQFYEGKVVFNSGLAAGTGFIFKYQMGNTTRAEQWWVSPFKPGLDSFSPAVEDI